MSWAKVLICNSGTMEVACILECHRYALVIQRTIIERHSVGQTFIMIGTIVSWTLMERLYWSSLVEWPMIILAYSSVPSNNSITLSQLLNHSTL